MLVNRVDWGRRALSLILGLSLFALAGNVQGDPNLPPPGDPNAYWGADVCGKCHVEEYGEWNPDWTVKSNGWSTHGHAWMHVNVNGQAPSATIVAQYAGLGLSAPTLPPMKSPAPALQWSDVIDLVAYFKPGMNASVLLKDGRLVEGNYDLSLPTPLYPSIVNPMPGRCNKCHNTAGIDTGTGGMGTEKGFTSSVQGTWKLAGIQCEQCHGPNVTMDIPDGQVCRDCHSSGDKGLLYGSDPALVGFRIPFDPAKELFSNHHPEGDEYRRSPHKNMGCTGCHDPHLSVWQKKGGIRYADNNDEESVGTMCTHCHSDVQIRGPMGKMLVCTDCHMPERSGAGERMTHLFRINTEPLDSINNWKEEKNDSWTTGKALTKYWKNFDGTTGAGDSFVTLDMACSRCHLNMNLEQLSRAAKYIHREPKLIDITANGFDSLSDGVTTTTSVAVNFSVDPGEKVGMPAEWWIVSQGPKGWSSWNGSAWKSGLRAWRKNVPLAKVDSQNVFKGTLATGQYTYWGKIYPNDGSEFADSVPVNVLKKKR